MNPISTFCIPNANLPAHPMVDPTGGWEYSLAVVAGLILAASFACGIRWTFDVSREAHPDHIKRRILDDPAWGPRHE
jgi:hypothetical protein